MSSLVLKMYLFSLKDPEEITFVLSAEEIQMNRRGEKERY
jgi:hypothetical protein